MKKTKLAFSALLQHGMRAAVPVVIIMGGHWLRYGQLDERDYLIGASVFAALVILSSWFASMKAENT
jgi:hypothetical protein